MRQDSGIGVLDKAVGVLHVIAESPCGLAELCERTGLPRATAHRLAAGLEVHRLLARDSDGRWCLGPALNELAGQVNDPLLAASAAVLPRLREITGESVQLYRREGISRVCVVSTEWQFMQTLSGGMPAWRLLRAPKWQYRHGICESPACSLCEKAIGCGGE